jgi:hypothetical protein
MRPCDATYCGLPVGPCSGDRLEIWHGMATPAVACGKHASVNPVRLTTTVFRGHRVRAGVARPYVESDIVTAREA